MAEHGGRGRGRGRGGRAWGGRGAGPVVVDSREWMSLVAGHNPEMWKRAFARAASSRNSSELHKLRIEIMCGTWSVAAAGFYTLPSGERVELDVPLARRRMAECAFYGSAEDCRLPARPPFEDTEVMVEDGDCVEAALRLKAQGYRKVCVLNMASRMHPGGGFTSGAGAQEENLFRRTNYVHFLATPDLVPERRWRYPLAEFGGVFSEDVSVFRGSEADGYPFLPAPELLNFVAVAAYSKPPVTRDGLRLTPEAAEGTKRKMRAICAIAAANGCDALVLSAFGCGAYRNPPAHIAELFREVLGEYRGHFAKVSFAIFDDHNAHRAHNPEGNVAPFRRVFPGPAGGVAGGVVRGAGAGVPRAAPAGAEEARPARRNSAAMDVVCVPSSQNSDE